MVVGDEYKGYVVDLAHMLSEKAGLDTHYVQAAKGENYVFSLYTTHATREDVSRYYISVSFGVFAINKCSLSVSVLNISNELLLCGSLEN